MSKMFGHPRRGQEYSGYLPVRHLAPGLCDWTGFRRAGKESEICGGLNIPLRPLGKDSKEEESEGSQFVQVGMFMAGCQVAASC